MTDAFYPFLLLLIGGLLGASLNYFQYGFSSSFRNLMVQQRTAGVRALLWMLALAVLLFTPILAWQPFAPFLPLDHWGAQSHQGFIRPLSLAVPVGAFLFGIGMQIGCGCTSGTLNRVGQLQPLSFITLLFIIVGGTLAAFSFTHWQSWPTLNAVAFQTTFGVLPGLVIQLALFFGLYKGLLWLEHQRHHHIEPLISTPLNAHKRRLTLHPFLLAGLALALLNTLLLLVLGSPWAISGAFVYWGTALIELFSLPIDWRYWDYTLENATRLQQVWYQNPVVLTTVGLVLGALAVTLLHPTPRVKVTRSGFLASVMGGTIMGVGAVMAAGCNIGALFSGIASGSLHGWLWLVFALLGNGVGVYLKQRFFNKP
ncbi:YeeE/YedE family protein [Thiomicrorhabdus aquaedulcis]|uniref:YeeE/YedE family protein n=1 Tax=Thiomicrorhabdus aquaedulcis TaxID=2211106 RepID=UPI000FD98825|nr:YeeE/YedE family protein [Thiomicrorhabdus aquaedulcis]